MKTILKKIGTAVWKSLEYNLLAFPQWFWPVIFAAFIVLVILQLTIKNG